MHFRRAHPRFSHGAANALPHERPESSRLALIANANGNYALQIFVVFVEQGKHWVSASRLFEIRLD